MPESRLEKPHVPYTSYSTLVISALAGSVLAIQGEQVAPGHLRTLLGRRRGHYNPYSDSRSYGSDSDSDSHSYGSRSRGKKKKKKKNKNRGRSYNGRSYGSHSNDSYGSHDSDSESTDYGSHSTSDNGHDNNRCQSLELYYNYEECVISINNENNRMLGSCAMYDLDTDERWGTGVVDFYSQSYPSPWSDQEAYFHNAEFVFFEKQEEWLPAPSAIRAPFYNWFADNDWQWPNGMAIEGSLAWGESGKFSGNYYESSLTIAEDGEEPNKRVFTFVCKD